jgi:hypothetical protein
VTAELVPSVSIETLVMQRNAMVERVRAAHAALIEAEELAAAMFGERHRATHSALRNYTTHTEFTSDKGLHEAIKEIDGRCWEYLLHHSGLRTFMDAEARSKWDDAISKNDVPELTVENINATFSTMHAARGEMFERGVIAVFKGLSWDYKTHNGVMFGKRVILRYINRHPWGVDHAGCDKLDDLIRVMSVLDGEPEPDHRRAAFQALYHAKLGEETSLGYFTVRVFKNGNGHLTFLRPDLVDKMNAILARHYPGALPRSREEAHP